MIKEDKANSRLKPTFDYTPKLGYIVSNWTFFLSIGSVLIFLGVGYFYYHINLFYTFDEIKYRLDEINYTHQQEDFKKEQEDLKKNFVDLHNNLGIKFLYAEKFGAAKDEFNQVLTVDHLNKKALICSLYGDLFNNTSSDNYYNSIDYDPEIIQMRLDALMHENTSDPLPYFYIGNLAALKHEWNNAMDSYSKAINLSNEPFAAAYNRMGIVNAQTNEHNLSLKNFSIAVNLIPFSAEYQNNLADELYVLNDYKNASGRYNKSIELDPRLLDPYVGKSNSDRCLGELESAQKTQEKQIKLMEMDPIKNLPVNQKSAVYTSDSENIRLKNYSMKEYYYYYNIALTNYLLEREIKTQYYLKKAYDLHLDPDSESNVKKILNHDIKYLQNAQSNNTKLINRSNEFRDNVVTKM
jgi:hypothetical protein